MDTIERQQMESRKKERQDSDDSAGMDLKSIYNLMQEINQSCDLDEDEASFKVQENPEDELRETLKQSIEELDENEADS